MLHFLETVSANIDRLNRGVGRAVSWITLLIVVVVFTDVVMRYALNTSYVFTQELEWHLFAFIFLMGAGYTLLQGGHVRVDIIYQRLDRKQKAWIDLFGVLIFLIPGCFLVLATSIPFVINACTTGECSPDPGGIPYRFIVKAFIPAGFVLLLLQGLSMGIKALLIIIGHDTKYSSDHPLKKC